MCVSGPPGDPAIIEEMTEALQAIAPITVEYFRCEEHGDMELRVTKDAFEYAVLVSPDFGEERHRRTAYAKDIVRAFARAGPT